jgi:hypothetical protein
MNVSAEDFRRHFELLSDSALLATNRDHLIEGAQSCFDEEMERRGLVSGTPVEEAREVVAQTSEHSGMVEIATYMVAEEASLARGLLESAEIPSKIDVSYTLGPVELRLLVPEDMVEQALEVLESEISEEELAAQAEAAGLLEEEAIEEE